MKSWTGLPALPRRPAGEGARFRALGAALATCIVLLGFKALIPHVESGKIPVWKESKGTRVERPFEWAQIVPSKSLKFQTCFDNFECAKLSVPLDYFNGTYPDDTVSIAITKLPAKVSIDDPRYGGPILINPGGPGGPGALFTLLVGKSLQTIVDAETHSNLEYADLRYFDILGFDPRGIGETEPAARCISDPAAAWSWNLREGAEGILGSSDAALGRLWSMSQAWGSACKQAMEAGEGPDIKQYMATAFVARDMLEIVERHATYIAEILDRLKTKKPGCLMPDSALYKSHEAKLQYWGFSYGTFLGSTFASMYPDRIGRVILDGVVSSYDYKHSFGNGSLVDNQKSMDSFYTYCLASDCPLASPNATFTSIQTRVQTIIQSLYHNPLAINSPTGPEILTYSDLKSFIFSACYQPRVVFPLLSTLLVAIEARTGAILDAFSTAYQYLHIYRCPLNGSAPAIQYPNPVPTIAILCSDGIDQSHVSRADFEEYWQLLESISPTAGAIWSLLKMRCVNWHIRASYKYTGAFGGNTSHPILFLSNTADPVTPLQSAHFMHALFANSALLVTDAAGHCSVSAPNNCTMAYVRAYFQTGDVPREKTLCVPETSVWSLNSTDEGSRFYVPELRDWVGEKAAGVRGMGETEEAAWELMGKIAEGDLFGVRGLGGRGGAGMRVAVDAWRDSE